jgi:uncharacterized protein (TIGR03435 family)
MVRCLVFFIVAAAWAQQSPEKVQFEVVSIKPGDPMDGSSSSRTTPGGMQMRNTTLDTLVRGAYGLNQFQLSGGPKWTGTARFHVDAKLPSGANREDMQLMMRNMLADRFKLEFHRETRTLPEYALVVAKGGIKIPELGPDDPKQQGTSQGPRSIQINGFDLATLARMLISVVGAPVIDRTELKGYYKIKLQHQPFQGAAPDDEMPTIFAALAQIGLRLEPIKGPVEVVVIDRAEMPTEN